MLQWLPWLEQKLFIDSELWRIKLYVALNHFFVWEKLLWPFNLMFFLKVLRMSHIILFIFTDENRMLDSLIFLNFLILPKEGESVYQGVGGHGRGAVAMDTNSTWSRKTKSLASSYLSCLSARQGSVTVTLSEIKRQISNACFSPLPCATCFLWSDVFVCRFQGNVRLRWVNF